MSHNEVGLTDRRINGLNLPFNSMQITTWILFPTIVVHYYAFLMPLLWNQGAYIGVTVIFSLVTVLVIVFGSLTTIIDPCDEALDKKLPCCIDETNAVQCYICDIKVHHTSKHCNICKKCVRNFDHHCKWLNT